MASNDDDPPEQEIISPGSHELEPVPTPPGVIKSAFFTAVQYGMQGRAVAAYRGAVREAVGAVEELRNLDRAVADRKQAQLILEYFDELVAKPDLDRLTARAAEAKVDRIKAETKLYQAELQSGEERAAADARHREKMGKYQEQPAHKTPDAIDPNNLSPEEYEISQRMAANARRAASGHTGKKTTTRSICAIRDMLKARRMKECDGKPTPEDDAYCAAVDAAAEETIKDLGLGEDDDVIHL